VHDLWCENLNNFKDIIFFKDIDMRSEDGHKVIFDDISFLEIHEISDMLYSEVRKCILLARDFSASSSK
jgi:hypothetical protein